MEDPPGRTFKRIELGRFFGCELSVTDALQIAEAKNKKVSEIKALEMQPKFVRFSYASQGKEGEEKIPLSAHVAFQKEVFAKKWNMVHVSEISFTVHAEDFDEFERMTGVKLYEDFRDLSAEEQKQPYQGKERRKRERD